MHPIAPLNAVSDLLASIQTRLEVRIATFNVNELATCASFPLSDAAISFGSATFQIDKSVTPLPRSGGYQLQVRFTVSAGTIAAANVAVQFATDGWSRDAYVLCPACAYAGNRFDRVSGHYTQFMAKPSKDMEIVIWDRMQGLNKNAGPSRMDFRTGDFSTPAICYQLPALKKAFIVLTGQATELGNTGISVVENDARTHATTLISSPCVRPGEANRKRGDLGHTFRTGDIVNFALNLHVFDSADINGLFSGFFERRNEFRSGHNFRHRHDIPFSSCWAMQEQKYNEQNWVEEFGYYSVGMREVSSQDWQSSWVGGMNTVYPLLCEGSPLTVERAQRTFDWLISGQTALGYYNCGAYQGVWGGNKESLTRYNADILYFMVKEFVLLETKYKLTLPARWTDSLRKLPAAFCALWEKEGQIGHRIDLNNNEIKWGNTASAAILPAGLALAAKYFNEPRFLRVAKELAEYYHKHYVSTGIINGGPGDHLQCPDSEATAGAVDAFVTLFEETGEAHWLAYAKDATHQAASWTMTYDFAFPRNCTFGKLDMLTTGTVFANIQNQHSAPGICSLSGNSIFKLFRATGDVRYLDLIREIAHTIPQFMSRADRPIVDVRTTPQRWPILPPGWVNERVNTSDWEVRDDPDEIAVGEIFGGSTWAEVALMLTYAELPGIYVQTDTGLVSVFDHVEATLTTDAAGRRALRITNLTKFHASVKIFAETSGEARSKILGAVSLESPPRAEVAPGTTVLYPL